MSNKASFEQWAKQHGLSITKHPWHSGVCESEATQYTYLCWEASQKEIDLLKAKLEELKKLESKSMVVMWPFKTEPKISLEEYAAQQPVPPCGDSLGHYEWILQLGMSCPKCARKEHKEHNEQKEIDETRLAEKIAHAVNKIRTNDYKEKVSILEAGLESIFELAHDKSTGPAVPDTLWEIRDLASTVLNNSRRYRK